MSSKGEAAPPLDPARLPAHVAVIMDGNGRWARRRLLNRVRGHEQGVRVVRQIVRTSREIGLAHLTLYAFSTENWQRPPQEVAGLMALLERFLKSEEREMCDNNIRLGVIGEPGRLPERVQAVLDRTLAATAANDGLQLHLALSYGGRSEIVRMARRLAERVERGELAPAAIDVEEIAAGLDTAGVPDPDLLIRTSGEMRISNFMLWQIAYAEIFVTDTLWPDFTPEEFLSILTAFQGRERRFGRV